MTAGFNAGVQATLTTRYGSYTAPVATYQLQVL
jgi:hypothetical protein